MAIVPYTLEQAETDIATLRGQFTSLSEFIPDNSGSGVYIVNGAFVAVDPVNGGPETWHSLGSPGLANVASDHGRYRLTIEGEVEFNCVLHATAASASQATSYANTLPAQYTPAFTHIMTLGYNINVVGSDRWPRVVITTTGAVNVALPALANATQMGATMRIPLD